MESLVESGSNVHVGLGFGSVNGDDIFLDVDVLARGVHVFGHQAEEGVFLLRRLVCVNDLGRKAPHLESRPIMLTTRLLTGRHV